MNSIIFNALFNCSSSSNRSSNNESNSQITINKNNLLNNLNKKYNKIIFKEIDPSEIVRFIEKNKKNLEDTKEIEFLNCDFTSEVESTIERVFGNKKKPNIINNSAQGTKEVVITKMNSQKKPPKETSQLEFKDVNENVIVNYLQEHINLLTNVDKITFNKCPINNKVVSLVNQLNSKHSKLNKIEICNCNNQAKILFNSNIEIKTVTNKSNNKETLEGIDLINQMFGSLIGEIAGGVNNQGGNTYISGNNQKIPKEYKLAADHINAMGYNTRKGFLTLLDLATNKPQRQPGQPQDDGKNSERIAYSIELPQFNIPVLIKKNEQTISDDYYNLFMAIANRMILGQEEKKSIIINTFINSITESSLPNRQEFPKDPLFFYGQPGLGKTLFAKCAAAIMCSWQFIEEYNDFNSILWQKFGKRDSSGKLPKEVFDKIVELCVNEENYNRFLATVKLQENKDAQALFGFAGTYSGSEAGFIIQSMKKYFPKKEMNELSEEEKRIYFFPDGRIRKPHSCVLLMDEIDKFVDNNNKPLWNLLVAFFDNSRKTFKDKFLNTEIDFMKVFIIVTGNDGNIIKGPVSDRLNKMEMFGLSTREKVKLVNALLSGEYPVEFDPSYIKSGVIKFTDEAISKIVELLGLEKLGMRNLQRSVNSIVLSAIEEHKKTNKKIIINETNLFNYIDENLLLQKGIKSQDLKSGIIKVFTKNSSNEMEENHIIVDSQPVSNSSHKFTILLPYEQDNYRYEMASNFSSTIGTIISSTLKIMGTSAQFFQGKIGASSLVVQFEKSIALQEVEQMSLYVVTTIWSHIMNKPINQNISIIANCTIQGQLRSISNSLDRVKFQLSKNPNLKMIVLPSQDRTILENPIKKILANEMKQVEIKYVDNIIDIINILFNSNG